MTTKHLEAVPYIPNRLPPQDSHLQNGQLPPQDHFAALSYSYPLNAVAHPPVHSIESGDFQTVAIPRQTLGHVQNSGAVAGMDSMAGLDPANLTGAEALGDLQGFASNAVHYGLYKFLQRDADDPWNPVVFKADAGTAARESRNSAQPSFTFTVNQGMPTAFADYRDAATRSDCDTVGAGVLPSETNHVSRSRRSGARSMGHAFSASSVCDMDNSADTKSLAGNLSAINLQPIFSHVDVTSTSDDLLCRHCMKRVKTNSELKKHRQRHEKPHICNFDGCTRQGGFSTLNDLQRHKVSVHKQSGTRYRCSVGSCVDKEKQWPRADNFRSHLKRLHKEVDPDMDLQAFVIQPSDPSVLTTPDPSDEGDPSLAPFGAAVPHSTWISPEHEDARNFAQANSFTSRNAIGRSRNMATFMASPCLDDGSAMSVVTSAAEVRIQLPNRDPDLRSIAESSLAYGGMALPDPQTLQVHVPDGYGGLSMSDQQSCPPNLLSHAGMETSFTTAFESIDQANSMGELVLEETTSTAFDMKVDGEPPSGEKLGEMGISPQESRSTVEPVQQCSASTGQRSRNASHESSPSSSSEDGHSQRDGIRSTSSISTSLSNHQDRIREYDESRATVILQSLMEKGLLGKIMSNFGWTPPPKSSETPLGDSPLNRVIEDADCPRFVKTTATQSVGINEKMKDRFPCATCGKTFQRMCELRKHQKRHEKPYKCQYPECESKFGSKNDWKRHENSQHLHQEFIVCHTKLPQITGGRCNMVMFRQETFNLHVKNKHGIDEPKNAQRLLVRGRSGLDNKVEYACSSCSQPIQAMKSAAAFSSANGQDVQLVDHVCTSTHTTPQTSGRESSAVVPAKDSGTGQYKRSVTRINKRSRDSDKEGMSLARKRARGQLIWCCCQCEELASLELSFVCTDCSHYRCSDCQLEEVQTERRSDHESPTETQG